MAKTKLKFTMFLADILTSLRLLAVIAIIFGITFRFGPGTIFVLFAFGELTDALDGSCSERWPFPKNNTPKYRKYAVKYDMVADVSIMTVTLLYILLRVNLWLGLIPGVLLGLIAIVTEFMVYGWLFGHPEDCAKGSLYDKYPRLGKTVIMTRRVLYFIVLALIIISLVVTSPWTVLTKTIVLIVASIIALLLAGKLAWARLMNVSREEAKKNFQKIKNKIIRK